MSESLEDAKPPLTGMHGIAFRAGKDIFALFGVTEPTEVQMKSLLNVLCRMLEEEMHYVGNQAGWKKQYHAEMRKRARWRCGDGAKEIHVRDWKVPAEVAACPARSASNAIVDKLGQRTHGG